MKNILVYYTFQKNKEDKMYNLFAIPNTFTSINDIAVKDIISGFPLLKHKSNFHLRFKTFFSETEPKIQGWLDISNFNAKVPVINNAVYMKILELPSQNCSRIYNENSLNKFLPGKSQNSSSQSPLQQKSYDQNPAAKVEPLKPTQGFQGQGLHGKERKSHLIKSHSPQPEFNSDQPKIHNKIIQGNSITGMSHTHSSENLHEKEFSSVDNTTQKSSVFKTNNNLSSNPKTYKKKESLNLFEEEEKIGQKVEQMNPGKSGAGPENLLVFSPTQGTHSAKMPEFLEKEQFFLDDQLVGVLSGEEISELKRQYVQQKIDNKFAEIKDIWNKEEEAKKMRGEAANELEIIILGWAKKNNTRNNLRTLIATMKEILGKDTEWVGVNLSELLSDEQVKKAFVRAIRVVHPDKNQHKDYKQKYIAERVFYELNEAWKDYKNQHGIL